METMHILGKEIVRFMDANEVDIKLISKFHNEIIDKVKRRKAKQKSYVPKLEESSDSK